MCHGSTNKSLQWSSWLCLRTSVNPIPAFRTSYEVCGQIYSVQVVCCYRMLNANLLRRFQLWYSLKRNWVLKMNNFGLFERLLLDENSINRVNGLAGKGLSVFFQTISVSAEACLSSVLALIWPLRLTERYKNEVAVAICLVCHAYTSTENRDVELRREESQLKTSRPTGITYCSLQKMTLEWRLNCFIDWLTDWLVELLLIIAARKSSAYLPRLLVFSPPPPPHLSHCLSLTLSLCLSVSCYSSGYRHDDNLLWSVCPFFVNFSVLKQ